MNALMRIQVLVDSRQARAALAGLNTEMAATQAKSRSGFGLPWMSKWGNQVQWAGRQLIYNFTLPLAIAGTAATKWALDNEKAMTRVAKVYGDGSKQFNHLSQTELPALADAFEALSNRFGVHQAEVINIGADWAAAGASGIQLAKAVELTLQTMVLGEIDAAEATKNLISIQAQYGQGVGQLSKTIDILNMVENQTGASMRDLMDGMARAAGVARVAGVDVEHLGAMIAALTPAAGSAANAGNGLKTIISRILSPTQEARDLLKEMGVQIDEAGWNSMTATQRIESLSKEFDNLSDAQKAHMATVIGSRWQLNRIIILMRAVRDENSYYNKSLRATSDEQAVFNQKQFELQKVLESNPQRIKQAWTILQNSLTSVIVPLLPYITYLVGELARLANSFANLGGETQKFILISLVFLALVGPIARYVGSVVNLLGILTAGFHGVGKAALWAGTMLYKVTLGPFVAMGAAAIKLGFTLMASIGAAFMALPGLALKGIAKLNVILPAIRTFAAAVILQFRMIGFVLVISWGATTVLLQKIWYGFSVGMLGAMRAFAMTGVALWGVFTKALPVLFASSLALLKALAPMVIAIVTNPWIAAAIAVIGVLYAFKDQIANVFKSVLELGSQFGDWLVKVFADPVHNVVKAILNAFWALPRGVQQALLAVLQVVSQIAIQIYEWMSYLNPFARHSPSLVDNVTSGMDVITTQFARLAGVGSVFQSAYAHLSKFSKQMGGVGQFADDRKNAKNKGLFDGMIGDLKKLYPMLRRQEAAMTAQQRVVDALQQKLDEASYQLDKLTAAYQRHEDAMQNFADAPIQGMGAMSDAIFENELAQKKLQLQMMEWEKVNGSIDSMRDRLGLLQGDIEELTGRANELRMQGAGSDILGPIQDQIAAIEAQANAVRNTVNSSPVGAMQDQLEQLQAEGEMLQLQYDIKYDPLIHQIEQLANAQQELSYDEIVDGIKKHQAAMQAIEPHLQHAQQVHDALQQKYDKEKHKLDQLSATYQKTADVVGDLESALRSMGQAGAQANKKAAGLKKPDTKGMKDAAASTASLDTFRAGAGGNWPDPGGMKGITRTNMKDQSAAIEKFAQDQIDEMNKIFGGFDMFGPLKEWWTKTWDWIKENVGPVVTAVGDGIASAWEAVTSSFGGGKAGSILDGFLNGAKKVINAVVDLFNLFAPDLKRIFEEIVKAGERIWDKIGPAMMDLFDALGDLWDVLKPIVKIIGGALLAVLKVAASIFSKVLGPALDFVIDIVAAFIQILAGVIKVVANVVKFVVALLKGDWKKAWEAAGGVLKGLWDIVSGTFKAIWATISGVVKIIWGVIEGFVTGIVEFFQWLYDVLVGHSIIPDMIDAIVAAFKVLAKVAVWVWEHVLAPLVRMFTRAGKWVFDRLKDWWPKIKAIFKVIWTLGKWFWDHVFLPLFKFLAKLWNGLVKPELKEWWGRIKAIWNVLWTLGKWIWQHVLQPVFERLKSLWQDKVKPELREWWGRIVSIWDKLKQLGGWIKQHVMDPIFDKIKSGWQKVRDWLQGSKDMLTSPVKGIVNTVIRGVNKLISGLNKVSDVLPGIEFHVNLIPELAEGGNIPKRRVGNGFMTSGARAIVGEGKANWPEFVIPTDPTYRKRAHSLMAMAQSKIGYPAGEKGDSLKGVMNSMARTSGGIPMFGIGGWLGDVANSLINKLPDNIPIGHAAAFLMKPFFSGARGLINNVGWSIPRGMGQWGINKVEDWVKSFDIQFGKEQKEAQDAQGMGGPAIQRALRFARSQVGKPYQWGGVGPNGYDCSGFMSAITNVIRGKPPHSRVGATGSFPWPGFAGGFGGAKGFTIGSTRNYGGSGVGHMAGTLGGVNVESSGGVGVHMGAGARGWNSSGFTTHAHLTKAAEGAIVRATRNGSYLLAGEGGRDEAVMPLPPGWRNSVMQPNASGETHIHINGDLEFPNITSGDDAEKFIDNIKALARD